MNIALRVGLYFALTSLVVVFGQRFVTSLSTSVERQSLGGRYQVDPTSALLTNNTAAADAAATNGAPTNAIAAVGTNRAVTGVPPIAGVPNTNTEPRTSGSTAAEPAPRSSKMGLYGALALGSLLGLALLVGYDVSHLLASRAQRELFNDDGEGTHDPEYDAAEQVWADGDHLEAIRLMREYFRKNPRELHVALRIAEIYEKDLNTPLAAALEFEEVLKRKFDPERWGWTAIHLCNLYARMNKPERMEELMRQIVQEAPQTAAAKKAREKLGLPADAGLATQTPSGDLTPPDDGSQLPRGFKPKKS